MNLYTMGFTKKSAEGFFSPIIRLQIPLLIDIRLNNNSQLAGFTKGRDLKYFLNELCHCDYKHEEIFAPSKELLKRYKQKELSWEEYEVVYAELFRTRNMLEYFQENFCAFPSVLLLCSEPTPEKCHRRLLAEALEKHFSDSNVIHL